MKHWLLILAALPSVLSAAEVKGAWMEIDEEPTAWLAKQNNTFSAVNSGDTLLVNDDRYIIIRESDWVALTNNVNKLMIVAERRWKIQHSTENGRREYHGKPTKTEIDTEKKVRRTVYADGYIHEEPFVVAKRTVPLKKATPPYTPARRVLPTKLQEKRDAIAKRPVKTVNATFTAGGKVQNVEEAK